MIKFGVTDTGFIAPTYEELLDDIENDLKVKFGSDISLTSNSNFGALARIIAWREYELIQQLELIHYSGFTTTATNTALDRMGSNYNVWRKVEMPAHARIVITTSEEYLIQAGEEFMTNDGYTFALIEDVITKKQEDGTWQGIGNVEAIDTGADTNVLANTITIVSNPDEIITNVTNPEPAGGGQDYEDDASFRKRIIQSMTAAPGPTKSGIISALFNVSGVRDVGIIPNPLSTTDKYGNPPYTVHIYVLGGDDEEIAKTLANNVAAGISLTGSKTFNVKDKMGNSSEIKFDNATAKDITVKVKLSTNINFNKDKIADMKSDIANQINTLKMGQTVHLTKLYTSVYDYDGVEDAEIEIGALGGKPIPIGSKDIETTDFEVPVTRIDYIEVDLDEL